jgi:hypothetical protein
VNAPTGHVMSDSKDENTYYGKDCPVGKVQVEFVGAHAERYSEYGFKPGESAFLEVYVDGRRFRINVGTFHDGVTERRGLHIVGDSDMEFDKTSINAGSVFYTKAVAVPAGYASKSEGGE